MCPMGLCPHYLKHSLKSLSITISHNILRICGDGCWYFKVLCTTTSSTYVTTFFSISPRSTVSKAVIKADRFLNPHGPNLYWYTWFPNWKLVNFQEDLCNGTWWKALSSSMVLINLDPQNLYIIVAPSWDAPLLWRHKCIYSASISTNPDSFLWLFNYSKRVYVIRKRFLQDIFMISCIFLYFEP